MPRYELVIRMASIPASYFGANRYSFPEPNASIECDILAIYPIWPCVIKPQTAPCVQLAGNEK